MNRIYITFALLTIAVAATPAHGDSASISGDACHNADDWGPFAAISPSNEYGSHGALTRAYDLVCPVSLDGEFVGGRWRDFSWARITAHDGNYVSQVSCKLHAKTLPGTHYYSSTRATGGSWSGGARVLSWTNPLNSGFYVGPVSVLNFECHMQSNSNYQGVRGYAIGE